MWGGGVEWMDGREGALRCRTAISMVGVYMEGLGWGGRWSAICKICP